MKKPWLLAALFLISGALVSAEIVSYYADVSCRCEGNTYQNTNRHDASKLSVRASSNGVKSWIKFNQLGSLTDYEIRSATLRFALNTSKAGAQSVQVSTVNDNCLDNIAWAEREITWNNAPGNDIAHLGLLDTTKTTLIQTVTFSDGTSGQQFTIDVTAAIAADTDGIVQFVLHNSPNLLDFATHDNPGGEALWPKLVIDFKPRRADQPNPQNGAVVETSQNALSWTNPDPNDGTSPIYCEVYFGKLIGTATEPNRPDMDRVVLPAGVQSVALNEASFPNFWPLENKTTYYWVVDCHDTSLPAAGDLLPGNFWSLQTDNNMEPDVNAGADQIAWLGKHGTAGQEAVTLDGTVIDDGLPAIPGQVTASWTQVDNGAPVVMPLPVSDPASVVLSQRAAYEFKLTASDGDKTGVDFVSVFIGTDSCDASHLSSGLPYTAADFNRDCIVDLADFATMIRSNWLDCTDTQTNCLD